MTRRETAPAVPASLGSRAAMPADRFEEAVREIDFEAMMEGLSGRLSGSAQSAFAKEQRAARDQIAQLARDFVEDAHYRPLFEWLLDVTLRRPVSVWGLGDGRFEYVERREGANSVVWQLLQAVAEAREEQPPIREGHAP